MKYRQLGATGPLVSAIGFGCYPMTGGYRTETEGDDQAAITKAVESGITIFDTADAYAEGANEELVGAALRPYQSEVIIATKFGYVPGSRMGEVDASPHVIRARCEGSLTRLGVDVLDLYIAHRLDPRVPIEETVGAMRDLVLEGKVRYIGLPETTADILRRAHATHPITAIEMEYSLWTREAEATVIPTAEELGIALLGYSPLGRGLLAGGLQLGETLKPHDVRRVFPRFQGANLEHNLVVAQRIHTMAAELSISSAQLVLAWILARQPLLVPIPGSRKASHVATNAAAVEIELTQRHIERLERVVGPSGFSGERYPAALQRHLRQ
jgi:aryl-alcohol dehydrogenase-like predicted oxidoreductase